MEGLIIELLLGIFIWGLLLLKRGKSQADWFLLAFFSLTLLVDIGELWPEETKMNALDILIYSLAPVLFFHHILSLQKIAIQGYYLLSYLFPVIYLFFILYALIAQEDTLFQSIAFRAYLFCLIFLIVIYGVLAVVVSQGIPKEKFPTAVRLWSNQFSWLYLVSFSLIIIVSLAASEVNAEEVKLLEKFQTGFSIGVSILVLYLGYRYGVLYPIANDPLPTTIPEHLKDFSSADIKLFHKIDELIRSDQLYLNGNLTLSMLSKRMLVNQKYLSQAINNTQHKSFTQYINELRIEFFIQKLEDDDFKNLSFEALAKECGFNSTSSFNRSFKALKGQTPSEYRTMLEE